MTYDTQNNQHKQPIHRGFNHLVRRHEGGVRECAPTNQEVGGQDVRRISNHRSMTQEELNQLHELLQTFQNEVLQGEMGDADDKAITTAIYIVEEYL